MIMKLTKSYKHIMIILLGFILVSVNIMRVLEPIEGIAINVALSDFVVPVFGLFLLYELIANRTTAPVKHWQWAITLALWLVITNIRVEWVNELVVADRTTVYGEWLKTLMVIAYFYIGYQVLRFISFRCFLWLYALSYSIFITYGFAVILASSYGYSFPFAEANSMYYFLGTYHDPNHGATFLAVSFFILMYIYHSENKILLKILAICLAIMAIPALFMTDSRGGLIAFGVGIIIYILYMYHNRLSNMLTFVMITLLSILGGLIFDSKFNEGGFTNSLLNSFLNFDKGMNVRDNLRLIAWHMGLDHWFMGVGRGNYLMNGKAYSEILGIPFLNEIPHNTYIGLFAETGIIGLILFGLPLIYILYLIYKSRSPLFSANGMYRSAMGTFIAALSALLIQAYVLNVENRRTYWLLAGVLVYIFEQNAEFIFERGEKKKDPGFRIIPDRLGIINILLAVACLTIFIYATKNVYIPKKEGWSSGTTRIELPVTQELTGQMIEVEYYLYTNQSGLDEQSTVSITIVEELDGETINVGKTHVYPRTNGTCRIGFNKTTSNSKMYLEVEQLSTELRVYRLWPRRLLSEAEVLTMNRQYYLVNQEEQVPLQYSKWTSRDDEQYEKTTFIPLISNFSAVTYDDKIRLDRIDCMVEGKTPSLVFTYTALQDIDRDYVIWLFGNPDNLHNIAETRFYSNNEYYSPLVPVETSKWEAEKQYKVVYEMPRNYGWYRLVGGIYYKDNDTTIRLTNFETEESYDIYGWINLGKATNEQGDTE